MAPLTVLWRFASRRAPGSAAPFRSRRRWRPCCGPIARRRTHYISPHNSARPDKKFGARRRTVRPQSRNSVFPDTAPAYTPNVSPCDSPLLQEDTGFRRRIKPDCGFRPRNRRNCAQAATTSLRPAVNPRLSAIIKIDCLRRKPNLIAGRPPCATLCFSKPPGAARCNANAN